MLEQETRHLFRRGQPADDEVEFAQPQLFQQHGVLSCNDLERCSCFLSEEQSQRARHDVGRHCGQRTDAQRHLPFRICLCDRVDALPQGG
jgi:hypothetical protein